MLMLVKRIPVGIFGWQGNNDRMLKELVGGFRAMHEFARRDGSALRHLQRWARELRKVPVAGGVASALCQFPSAQEFKSGTWSPDGSYIVFAAGPQGRLYGVAARGGEPKPTLDPPNDKTVFSAPHFLRICRKFSPQGLSAMLLS